MFKIKNEGYFSLVDVRGQVFIWKGGGLSWILLSDVRGLGPEKTLPPTQTMTMNAAPAVTFESKQPIDLAVIVEFRTWPFTALRMRRAYRFVGGDTPSGYVWNEQPSPELEEAYEKFIASRPVKRD